MQVPEREEKSEGTAMYTTKCHELERSPGPDIEGHCMQAREFALYPVINREPLCDLNPGGDMITPMLQR